MFARSASWTATLVVLAVVLSPIAPTVLSHAPSAVSSAVSHSAAVPGPAKALPTPKVAAAPSGGALAAAHAATEQRILSALHSKGVPMRYAYLPNFNAQVSRHGDVVQPTYPTSPAPYGIAAYGVENTTGNATAYILNSPSYEGQIVFNSLDEFYLDDDSADYIGAQLNTVVSNITLFGNSSYSFWNQNVVDYSARSNLLQFIDNIWNFSSPAFYLSPNVFNATSPNGTLVAPEFYYGLGPVINVSMPFTLQLYINATTTNVNGFPDDIVYYNYSVIKSGATLQSGAFDWAIFNSQDPANPVATIPQPEYQINGFYASPAGFLPYESELVFCGPGGGSTTTVRNIDATLNMWYLNTSTGTYQNVPSAVAYGTNTGETIEGATEWYDPTGTVHVGAGPTLPFPLWNSSPSASPGFDTISGTITPDTSFVFVNAGSTLNFSTAAYAPVPIGGSVAYNVPSGNYTGVVMMSNYDLANFSVVATVPTSWSITSTLTPNPAMGLYTPLIAFSNSQLGELAVSGSGTLADPYVMPNDAAPSLNPLFGQFNDYAFPVFPGLLFAHTNAYVVLNASSTFAINYAGPQLDYVNFYGLPSSNHLQFELYGTTHVSLVDTMGISGWVTNSQNGFPIVPLLVWNSSETLIAGDTFSSQGSSVLLYGGTDNTVFGNWFTTDPSLSDPALANNVLYGTYPFGPQVYESGDRIFNNAFLTQIPAYSPASTIYYESFYSSFNSSWVNQWNVSAQPASSTWVVNGIPLTGSIVNGSYLGGNLWWDYVPGASALPFGGDGLIAVGGDWLPIVGDTVSFVETGLPDGTFWSVVFGGLTVYAFAPAIALSWYDGSYAYTVGPQAGYTTTPSSGTLTLAGGPGGVAIVFAAIPENYTITFVESGLPSSTTWSAAVNGLSQSGSGTSIVFVETAGPYTWAVAPVVGLLLQPSSGSGTIDDTNVTIDVAFSAPAAEEFSVAFVETGLAAGSAWSVTLAGTEISSVLDVITFSAPNGSYAFTVANVSGYAAPVYSGIASVSGSASNNDVVFTALPVALSGTYTPTTATVWIDGAQVNPTNPGNFSVHVAPGSHSVTVTAVGYLTYYNNVSIGVGGSAALSIALTAPSSPTTTTSAGLTGANLALLAGVSVLALIFLIGMVYFWSRARRPPVMMKPEPPASAGPGSSS